MSEMFKIKLPDGSVREMPEGSTPADVAAATPAVTGVCASPAVTLAMGLAQYPQGGCA